MTADLVARLRQRHQDSVIPEIASIYSNAADRIEDLEDRLTTLRESFTALTTSPEGECAFCGYPDRRHRAVDVQLGQAIAGDDLDSIAADYDLTITRMLQIWQSVLDGAIEQVLTLAPIVDAAHNYRAQMSTGTTRTVQAARRHLFDLLAEHRPQ